MIEENKSISPQAEPVAVFDSNGYQEEDLCAAELPEWPWRADESTNSSAPLTSQPSLRPSGAPQTEPTSTSPSFLPSLAPSAQPWWDPSSMPSALRLAPQQPTPTPSRAALVFPDADNKIDTKVSLSPTLIPTPAPTQESTEPVGRLEIPVPEEKRPSRGVEAFMASWLEGRTWLEFIAAVLATSAAFTCILFVCYRRASKSPKGSGAEKPVFLNFP